MRREGLSLRAEVRGWYCPSPSPKILKGHPTHTPHISNNSSPASKGKHPWPGNQGILLLSPRCLSHELESVGTIAILRGVRGGEGETKSALPTQAASQHAHTPSTQPAVLGYWGQGVENTNLNIAEIVLYLLWPMNRVVARSQRGSPA